MVQTEIPNPIKKENCTDNATANFFLIVLSALGANTLMGALFLFLDNKKDAGGVTAVIGLAFLMAAFTAYKTMGAMTTEKVESGGIPDGIIVTGTVSPTRYPSPAQSALPH